MRRLAVLLAVAGAGCGASDSSNDGNTGSGSGSNSGGPGTSGDDGDSGGGSQTGGGGTDATDDGGTDGGGDVEGEPARGIRIDLLEANQGVGIAIARNDALVGAGERNAPILADRNTLVTGYYALEPGFAHRKINGELTIETPGMDPQTASSVVTTKDQPMASWVYDDAFRWVIPAELIQPGTMFSVELFETTADHLGEPEQNPPPRIPQTGSAELGVEQEDLKLRVMLIPLRYNHPSQGWLEPDIGAEAIETVGNLLHDQNPVVELELEVHAMVDYPSSVQNDSQFGAILGFLSSLKSQEQAGANVYYAGIINTGCPIVGCTSSGVVGIAHLTNASQNDGNRRVSANMWNMPTNGAQTVVHEIGHNQGLSHIRCPGGTSSGNDPSYPYPDGVINNAGFGVRGFTLNRPDDFDYMSYCGPPWASDWTWLKTRQRISTLTSWGDGYVDPGPEGERILLGQIDELGSEHWWVIDGSVSPSELDPGLSVTFTANDGTTTTVGAAEDRLSETDIRSLRVPLPHPVSELASIVRHQAGAIAPIDLAVIDRLRPVVVR